MFDLETAPCNPTLTAEFEADYFGTHDAAARFLVIDITGPLLDRAADHVVTHALRAYDAIQLASACAAKDADPACVSFACTDAGLPAEDEILQAFPDLERDDIREALRYVCRSCART